MRCLASIRNLRSSAAFVVLLSLFAAAPSCRNSSLGLSSDELTVTPATLDFGSVYVGDRAQRTVHLANNSPRARRVGLTGTAPFEAAPTVDLEAGGAVELIITFAPSALGATEGSVAIEEALTITVRGVGTERPECQTPTNSCELVTFDPVAAHCAITHEPDGTACTSQCIGAGVCAVGLCMGSAVDCDDSDVCTDDHCAEERGCLHPARICPGDPTDPCRTPSCDPAKGCLLTDAADGTACGPRDCQAQTARVCIAAKCVTRPLPTVECLNQLSYLKASDADTADAFGSRIALSADGRTLAISAPAERSGATGIDGDQLNNMAPFSGAVYVFKRSGSSWVQEAYLKASNTGAEDSLGSALALSGTGDVLAVGAQLEDSNATGVNGPQSNNAALDSGAVYLFARAGGGWAQSAYLKADNAQTDDRFGSSVALSADGTVVAIGATGEDSATLAGDELAPESGAVYRFQNTALGWQQTDYLKATNPELGDLFGFTVALSATGDVLAVGAVGEDSGATGLGGSQADNSKPQSGAVYLFTTNAAPTYVKAFKTSTADVFGFALALSPDGNTLAVGAYGEDSNATGVDAPTADAVASQSGAVYLYRRRVTGWRAEAFVKASNTGVGDAFGSSLALSRDGAALLVGAWSEDSAATGFGGHERNDAAPDSGAAYLFHRSAAGVWTQARYVKAPNTDPGDAFGHAVSLSGDGSVAAVAGVGEDSRSRGVDGNRFNEAARESGAVYVFALE